MSDEEDPFAIEGEADEDAQSNHARDKQESDLEEEDDFDDDELDEVEDNVSDADEEEGGAEEDSDLVPRVKRQKKGSRMKKSAFIDDEAELSGDDASADEFESSDDDDKVDTDLVDLDAKDLGSDEEEDIRRMYHKQLETEDRRALLLMQEQLEENEITAGATRRRKFRWQTKELMENSLRRHYDPDDDDSQDLDDEEDDIDYSELAPRLRRPNAESILIGSTRIMTASNKRLIEDDHSSSGLPKTYSRRNRLDDEPSAGPSNAISDDSNSNLMHAHPAIGSKTGTMKKSDSGPSDLNRFVIRDKELVEALSTKETIIVTREERDRNIQRELKRVLQSKSIFDQLYG